jgi:TetR/AcrR family transcriptional regulator, transcriptional repressor for nem operon
MRFEKGRKAETRRHILDVASKRFRQDGISASGIAGIMGDAGLTNGAFYPHFSSKEELVREAASDAVVRQRHRVEDNVQAGSSLESVIRAYLSREHLNAPSCGCPSAALMPELAREPKATREAYAKEIQSYLSALSALLPPADPAVTARRATAIFTLLAGTLQYARVVTDPEAADRILEDGVKAALLLAEALP